MIRVACDLDGTMIDSTRALVEAYRGAGVEYVPNVPWRYWCTEAQHDLKGTLYPDALRAYGRVLPLGRLAVAHGWRVLTGASAESVRTVTNVLSIDLREITYGLSRNQKVATLVTERYDLFFDDDERVIEMLRDTSCQGVLA